MSIRIRRLSRSVRVTSIRPDRTSIADAAYLRTVFIVVPLSFAALVVDILGCRRLSPSHRGRAGMHPGGWISCLSMPRNTRYLAMARPFLTAHYTAKEGAEPTTSRGAKSRRAEYP